MSKLIMLVGISGSGKSTYAKKLAKEQDAVIVSSDNIREQLFGDVDEQSKNKEVFNELHKQAQKHLSQGQTVIYDATNLSRKRRTYVIKHVLKADEYEVVYVAQDLLACLYHNDLRERHVPPEVVQRMYKTIEIPTIEEGWNKVEFYYGDRFVQLGAHESLDKLLKCLNSAKDHGQLIHEILHQSFYPSEELCFHLDSMFDLPQDSTYHTFSVSRHTYHVIEKMREVECEYKRNILLLAALFHDIGKPFCKSFTNYKGEPTRYASFYNHENVGAVIASIVLYELGAEEQMIKDVVDLVQFHMKPMNWSEKGKKKYQDLMTPELFEMLMILHEADTDAK